MMYGPEWGPFYVLIKVLFCIISQSCEIKTTAQHSCECINNSSQQYMHYSISYITQKVHKRRSSHIISVSYSLRLCYDDDATIVSSEPTPQTHHTNAKLQ